ncbi:DDE superfamily endonuclease [Gillisia sp. Hel_I_86]|nr:DDE superfamily endonuclease [Gillisia sp. Hel_I_86]
MWCITAITPQYRERMYKLLDLYATAYDEGFPVVCMDEKSKQLIIDIRNTIPLKPRSLEKHDYEYTRNGTRNVFVAVEALAGKRNIKVTQTRKKADFAHFIKEVVDQDYPKAKKVRLVLDDLNTHFSSSFYETFSKGGAERILGKIDFYYTPKHGSWLNMAEIEINMMDRECLARRIGEAEKLINEISSWTENRNAAKKKIHWKFTKQDADEKLAKHYVA